MSTKSANTTIQKQQQVHDVLSCYCNNPASKSCTFGCCRICCLAGVGRQDSKVKCQNKWHALAATTTGSPTSTSTSSSSSNNHKEKKKKTVLGDITTSFQQTTTVPTNTNTKQIIAPPIKKKKNVTTTRRQQKKKGNTKNNNNNNKKSLGGQATKQQPIRKVATTTKTKTSRDVVAKVGTITSASANTTTKTDDRPKQCQGSDNCSHFASNKCSHGCCRQCCQYVSIGMSMSISSSTEGSSVCKWKQHSNIKGLSSVSSAASDSSTSAGKTGSNSGTGSRELQKKNTSSSTTIKVRKTTTRPPTEFVNVQHSSSEEDILAAMTSPVTLASTAASPNGSVKQDSVVTSPDEQQEIAALSTTTTTPHSLEVASTTAIASSTPAAGNNIAAAYTVDTPMTMTLLDTPSPMESGGTLYTIPFSEQHFQAPSDSLPTTTAPSSPFDCDMVSTTDFGGNTPTVAGSTAHVHFDTTPSTLVGQDFTSPGEISTLATPPMSASPPSEGRKAAPSTAGITSPSTAIAAAMDQRDTPIAPATRDDTSLSMESSETPEKGTDIAASATTTPVTPVLMKVPLACDNNSGISQEGTPDDDNCVAHKHKNAFTPFSSPITASGGGVGLLSTAVDTNIVVDALAGVLEEENENDTTCLDVTTPVDDGPDNDKSSENNTNYCLFGCDGVVSMTRNLSKWLKKY